ncbi:MAG: hypothetical protein KDA80_00145 [Planctomycetaceae bacterium]|nr:hypothetical protein [Planctomycetaceae bacterium]
MTIQELATWSIPLGIGSLLLSLVGIWGMGILIVRLPADHFRHDDCSSGSAGWGKSTRSEIVWRILLNFVGIGLIAAGVAMLILPGQGLLSILLGISLVEFFPGKRQLLRWILDQTSVQRTLNWFRRKAGRPPFRFPAEVCG